MMLTNSFLSDYNLIIIIAVITFALSIILHSTVAFAIQAVLFAGIIIIDQAALSFLYIPISVLQIFVGLFLVYRLKKAIDRNYMLVLEKTHQAHPNFTKGRKSGTQRSFL